MKEASALAGVFFTARSPPGERRQLCSDPASLPFPNESLRSQSTSRTPPPPLSPLEYDRIDIGCARMPLESPPGRRDTYPCAKTRPNPLLRVTGLSAFDRCLGAIPHTSIPR